MDGSKGKTTTRLMITKMVLENFKSYAGVQNIGPFHKRFSSIVGPNGSGKSNVIDALLFVFGKRAKQLRLNKVSELIHKSSGFPNLDYANVEVHFQLINDNEDDEDDFEVVPGSEFVVSRTAYKNNTSKYAVDSRTSNFNDVGILLRSYGIDLDNNRFLILQGEVEQIAMMKPKGTAGTITASGNASGGEDGLLEYLEDIIGSNKYVEQIEEWSKTLDDLNEQRLEKVNRMKIAERDRDNLSGSKEEAEDFLEKERDIRRKQNMLYQLFIYEAIHIVESTEAKKKEASERLAEEKKSRSENEALLKQSEKEYDSTKSKYDTICEELSSATADFSAFERRDIKLQEDKKHVSNQIKKLEATIAKESKRDLDGNKEAEKFTKDMSAMTNKINELEEAKNVEEAKLEEILEGLQVATAGIRETVEAKQAELGKAQALVADVQTEKETTATALSLVMSRVDSNKAQYAACVEKINKFTQDSVDLNSKLKALATQKTETIAKISSLEKEIESNVQQETGIQQSLQTSVMNYEEGKMSLQNSNATRSSVVEAILKAGKKNGPLANAGIRGRLGDLGTISAEYDVAISTACGGMLEHIVVETVEGGQACLEYIRQRKLGRVSLIVLDQMEAHSRNMVKPFSAPKGATRLFDLVQISSEDLKPAMFCALGNTLVTSTLDSAVKLAYVGDKVVYRIVAMDGNVIETSGAMSGGGKQLKSGSMRLSSGVTRQQNTDGDMTEAKLAELEAITKELQSRLANHRLARNMMEKDLKECKTLLKQIEVDTEKSKMMLKRFSEQQKDTQELMVGYQNGMELDASEKTEVAKLESKIKSLDAQISKSSPNLASLEEEVASLQKQILDVGGPKLKRTQLRVSEYSEQLEQLRSQLSSKEVEFNNGRKATGKAAQLVAKAQNELVVLKEKFHALTEEHKDMENDAMKLLSALETATQLKNNQEELLRETKSAHDALVKHVNSTRTLEIDLQTQCDGFTKVIKDNNDGKHHWEKQLKAVRAKHLEEKLEMKTLLKSFQLTGAKKNIGIIGSSSAAAEVQMDVEGGDDEAETNVDDSDIQLFTREELSDRYNTAEPEAVNTEEGMLAILTKMKHACSEMKHDIGVMEVEKDKLKDNVNMGALMEYLRKDADYRMRLVDLEKITTDRNAARRSYEECRRKRLEEFMAGFGIITLKLKEMYQMITLGGDAELELVDSLDPFAEGIVFSVRPPKKSWKNISNLSGGEKTLSSLALVFALHHYKPTPLYVMDEIDAALDFKNVSIVANYIKERTKNAQFVIISLR